MGSEMRWPLSLLSGVLLALLWLGVPVLPLWAEMPALGNDEFFEKKVRPILAQHCYQCHSTAARKLKGDLLLDSRAALLKGGESGAVILPGSPAKSRLIEAIQYKNIDLRMPPRGKLSNAAIADLAEWVNRGAPWPLEALTQSAGPAREAFDLEKRKRAHWAWQPIRPQKVPTPGANAW